MRARSEQPRSVEWVNRQVWDRLSDDTRVGPVLWVLSFVFAVVMSPLWALAMLPSLGLLGATKFAALSILPVAVLCRALCEHYRRREGNPSTLGELRSRLPSDGSR
jgi:hypothetical protein